MAEPTTIATLHRSPIARTIGGPALQPFFLVWTVVWAWAAIARDRPVLLLLAAVGLILWLVGATAWIRVDDTGIHRRCYLPRTDLWPDIDTVELYTRSFGVNSALFLIRIHRHHTRHWLAPATGRNRHAEQFARELVATARAHGVTASTSGWGAFDE